MEAPEALQLQLLKSLFGLETTKFREWSGIFSYCEYLKLCFIPLLRDEYAPIWAAIDKPSPVTVEECWLWFIAASTAVHKIWNQDTSIEDIWKQMISEYPLRRQRLDHTEQSACFVAIFAVVCWATGSLQPRINGIDFQSPRPFLVEQGDHPPLPIELAYRPMHALFDQFHKTMKKTRWRHPIGDIKTMDEAIGESKTTDFTILHITRLEHATLKEIGKIRVKWVSNISSHLDFDAGNRELQIFKFPSFCALSIIAASVQRDQRSQSVFPYLELLRALHGAVPGPDSHYHGADNHRDIQLHREILMSYRLIFAQTMKSRRQAKALLQKLNKEQPPQYDKFLGILCTQSCKAKSVEAIPVMMWPITCQSFDGSLQEESTYSSQDDFPLFGQRLAKLQAFSLRQRPSKLTDLWRDRRDPLQWYTFWAVLVIGGLSLLLSMLQLGVAVVQLGTSLAIAP